MTIPCYLASSMCSVSNERRKLQPLNDDVSIADTNEGVWLCNAHYIYNTSIYVNLRNYNECD